MKRPDERAGVSAVERDRRWWALRVGVPVAALILAGVLGSSLLVVGTGSGPEHVPQVAWETEEEPGQVTFVHDGGERIPAGTTLRVWSNGTTVDASDQPPIEEDDEFVVAASGGDVTLPESAWEEDDTVLLVWVSDDGELEHPIGEHRLTDQ